jgi:hypothetical protein
MARPDLLELLPPTIRKLTGSVNTAPFFRGSGLVRETGCPVDQAQAPTFSKAVTKLLQLRVLRLSLLKDGDVRIGVFPQRQKILVLGAGFGRVPL